MSNGLGIRRAKGTLGKFLRDRRETALLTQCELARRAGVHQDTVSNLESGYQDGHIGDFASYRNTKSIASIGRVLDCSLELQVLAGFWPLPAAAPSLLDQVIPDVARAIRAALNQGADQTEFAQIVRNAVATARGAA